ncbi:hypothetical protein Lal_00012305 [Lupinus albus]|nr:hypothetical protein Lal_00012305 [Lupinus albus]
MSSFSSWLFFIFFIVSSLLPTEFDSSLVHRLFEQQVELEAKYQKLYEPLYTKANDDVSCKDPIFITRKFSFKILIRESEVITFERHYSNSLETYVYKFARRKYSKHPSFQKHVITLPFKYILYTITLSQNYLQYKH